MRVGMLWLDSDRSESLPGRIRRASNYYREKYGRSPDLCFVHPSAREEGMPSSVDGLEVRAEITVLPDHFWIGVREREEA